jgi:hypothetical protein
MTANVYPKTSERVSLRRLLWVAPLAIAAAVAANFVVRTIALAVLDVPPAFIQLTTPAFLPLTVIGVLGAVIAFAIVGRLSRSPVRTFTIVATVVLVLSFIPDIGLLVSGAPGTTLPGVLALMVMHVVAAVLAVGILTRLVVER